MQSNTNQKSATGCLIAFGAVFFFVGLLPFLTGAVGGIIFAAGGALNLSAGRCPVEFGDGFRDYPSTCG